MECADSCDCKTEIKLEVVDSPELEHGCADSNFEQIAVAGPPSPLVIKLKPVSKYEADEVEPSFRNEAYLPEYAKQEVEIELLDSGQQSNNSTSQCAPANDFSKKDLEANVNSHPHNNLIHKIKEFNCYICGKEYSQKRHLKTHFRSTHLNIKLHCEMCGAKFIRKDHLNFHLKNVHLKMTNHKCDFCGKEFGKVHNLTRHRLTHLVTRPLHKCDLCGKEFTLKDSIKRHKQRFHTLEDGTN